MQNLFAEYSLLSELVVQSLGGRCVRRQSQHASTSGACQQLLKQGLLLQTICIVYYSTACSERSQIMLHEVVQGS